jgi:hypothetical protein
MTETITPSRADLEAAHEAALVELQRHREALTTAERQLDEAAAAFDETWTGSGEKILDAPQAGARISKRLAQLRDQGDLAELAIEAARPRVAAAETAFVRAEAAVYEHEARIAAAALAEHQARTDELLAQLREHEGEYVPAWQSRGITRGADSVTLDERPAAGPPKSSELRRAVTLAEHRARILRDLAEGVDPAPALASQASIVDGTVDGFPIDQLYPPSVWGPDAVVPAPAYLTTTGAGVNERESAAV